MYFKGDIIITDPMYIIKCKEDWLLCEYGEKLEKLNILSFITSKHGDEIGHDVVNLDTNKKLGEFCTDSCMVSVMSLAEVRKYNPEFDKNLGKNCYTVIEGFDGEICLLEMDKEDGNDQRLYFTSKGNIRFRTDFFNK